MMAVRNRRNSRRIREKKLCEHVISSGEDSGENSIVIMDEDEENGDVAAMQGCEPDPDQRPEHSGEEGDDTV